MIDGMIDIRDRLEAIQKEVAMELSEERRKIYGMLYDLIEDIDNFQKGAG